VVLVILRRAVVAVLLMWYLMVPPYRLDGDVWVVSQNVPVAKWTIVGRFESFDKCHDKWATDSIARIEASRTVPRAQWSRQQFGEYVGLRAFLDGRCVSSRAVDSQRK
jgi:hypothetical protein